MRNPDLIGSNRRALLLVILGIVLSLILFSMPLYSFNACVYTKKSPNTFVGDEKYRTVRAEVEQVADDYRAQGFAAEIGEDVLERVNSKGETTSLITFTVNQSLSKSPLSMLGCGFPSSYVLAAMLVLGAVNQFVNLAQASRWCHVGWFYWLLPVVVLLVAIFMIWRPVETAAAPLFIIGWCMLLYGAAELLGGVMVWKAGRVVKKMAEQQMKEDQKMIEEKTESEQNVEEESANL